MKAKTVPIDKRCYRGCGREAKVRVDLGAYRGAYCARCFMDLGLLE